MAGTCTLTITQLPEHGGAAAIVKRNALFECTAHTDATFAVTLTSDQMTELDGYYIYTVTTYPGAVTPTDNSDLAITDSRGLTLLYAAGNGLNLIDETSTLQTLTERASGTTHYQLIHKDYPLTFTVTNNAVNSATFNIELELTL